MTIRKITTAALTAAALSAVAVPGFAAPLETQVLNAAVTWGHAEDAKYISPRATAVASLDAPIPGHLGSVLTLEEQQLLITAWRDHDDEAARFILSGGMRTPLDAPAAH